MADELRGTPDRDGFGAQARRLLSEAVRLRGGVEGLRALALTDGPQHPDHFQVWVGALIQDGRLEAAAEAARQAIALLPLHGTAQGRICDALAWLATELKDSAGALDGRRQAWRAAPTRERLLALVATARACGWKEEILAAEAAAGGAGAAGPWLTGRLPREPAPGLRAAAPGRDGGACG